MIHPGAYAVRGIQMRNQYPRLKRSHEVIWTETKAMIHETLLIQVLYPIPNIVLRLVSSELNLP